MGLLDDFLLGRNRRSENNLIDDYFRRDTSNLKVKALNDKAFTTEVADTRASSLGAATALLRTTGSLPKGFFSAGVSAPIAFDNQGGKAYKKLRDAGIGAGSKTSQLYDALYGQQNLAADENDRLGQTLRNILSNNGRDGARQPFGSSVGNNRNNSSGVQINNAGFNKTNGSFLDGYRKSFTNILNDQSVFGQDQNTGDSFGLPELISFYDT